MPKKNILIPGLLALVAALVFAAPEAGAFGSSSNDQPASTAAADLAAGRKAADAGDHETAVRLLRRAAQADPNNADIHNFLGFSYRKLGNVDMAFKHYAQALKLDRTHRGAHEYIGELYLETGDLARAREHLAALANACANACPEYAELKHEVEEYEATHGG